MKLDSFVENSMGTIGERIKILRGKLNQSEFAERLGVHKNTVVNYERGDRFPDVPVLQKILQLFPGTNPGWLLTGEGSRRKADPAQEKYVMFPRYDLLVREEPERYVESGQVVDFFSFKEDWVKNFLGVPQKDLALLSVKGDGMSPSLSDGDVILVDLRSSRIEDSGIYVLEFDDALLVKRIQRKFDGSVVVISDNPLYEVEVLEKDRVDSLKIVGRVVWAGRKM